jgi:hypothetical protein
VRRPSRKIVGGTAANSAKFDLSQFSEDGWLARFELSGALRPEARELVAYLVRQGKRFGAVQICSFP